MAAAGWQEVLAGHALEADADRADFWDTYLDQNPDVLHRLLADLHKATHGSDKPATLDELWELVAAPRFATVCFGEALHAALAGRSERWLARQIGLHQSVLSRYVRDEMNLVNLNDPKASMKRIELIATALQVHPSYFVEWRRLWIMRFLDGAMTARPGISADIYRRFSSLQPHANGR